MIVKQTSRHNQVLLRLGVLIALSLGIDPVVRAQPAQSMFSQAVKSRSLRSAEPRSPSTASRRSSFLFRLRCCCARDSM